MTQTLQEIAKSKGIIYGGFPQVSAQELSNDRSFSNLFKQEYELLVAGFFGISVSKEYNQYNFAEVEPFFQYARQNGLLFRGHPLIWHEYNANWVREKLNEPGVNKEEINRIFTEEISAKVKQYKGYVYAWDVVNEAIHPEDSREDGLRKTDWLRHLGSNYIEQAFLIASWNDANAKLIYNDYGLAYGGDWHSRRRDAVLELLSKLTGNNAPIYGLGIQSHLSGEKNQDFDCRKFSQFLQDVESLGLKIFITELDVNDKYLPKDIRIRDRAVADTYYQYLSCALDNQAVTTVVSWGLTDAHSWLSEADWSKRTDGAEERPLLFDRDNQPKPAYYAVMRALSEAPVR